MIERPGLQFVLPHLFRPDGACLFAAGCDFFFFFFSLSPSFAAHLTSFPWLLHHQLEAELNFRGAGGGSLRSVPSLILQIFQCALRPGLEFGIWGGGGVCSGEK